MAATFKKMEWKSNHQKEPLCYQLTQIKFHALPFRFSLLCVTWGEDQRSCTKLCYSTNERFLLFWWTIAVFLWKMLIILDPTPLNPNLSRLNCKLVNNSYNDHLDKNGSGKPDTQYRITLTNWRQGWWNSYYKSLLKSRNHSRRVSYLCTVNFVVCFQSDTCYGCS